MKRKSKFQFDSIAEYTREIAALGMCFHECANNGDVQLSYYKNGFVILKTSGGTAIVSPKGVLYSHYVCKHRKV